MQLVGAKNWFIQKPFLLRSLGYGSLGGAIASALIWGGVDYSNSKIEDLSLLQNTEMMYALFCFLLLLGMFVAITSTYFSMRRYLRMSLDDLY
jgi:cell division transport system permease protein